MQSRLQGAQDAHVLATDGGSRTSFSKSRKLSSLQALNKGGCRPASPDIRGGRSHVELEVSGRETLEGM